MKPRPYVRRRNRSGVLFHRPASPTATSARTAGGHTRLPPLCVHAVCVVSAPQGLGSVLAHVTPAHRCSHFCRPLRPRHPSGRRLQPRPARCAHGRRSGLVAAQPRPERRLHHSPPMHSSRPLWPVQARTKAHASSRPYELASPSGGRGWRLLCLRQMPGQPKKASLGPLVLLTDRQPGPGWLGPLVRCRVGSALASSALGFSLCLRRLRRDFFINQRKRKNTPRV